MIEKIVKPELLWPIPVLAIQLKGAEEMNRGLAAAIFRKEKEILAKNKPAEVAGQTQGIGAHWLEYNVLKWEDAAVRQFREIVLEGLREFYKMIGDPDDPKLKVEGISCWANILRFGDSLEVHHHDPGFVSAHYQVQTGYAEKPDEKYPGSVGRKDNGHTVYFRPGFLDRSHGGDQNGPTSPWDHEWRRSVEPVEGKLFFFPSFVRHEVRPYMGKQERLSIAMDIFVKKQASLMYFGGPRWWVPGKDK